MSTGLQCHKALARFVWVLLLVPGPARGQIIEYRVTPVLRDNGTDLTVTMTFTGDAGGQTRVLLPHDRFGVPAMHRFVHDVAVVSGALRVHDDGDSTVLLSHAPGARVSLRYAIRYDSARAGFVPFGPSVDAGHYHFLGSQWMVRVGRADSVRRFAVQIEAHPGGGTVAGSFGIGGSEHQLSATYADMEWTVIAGGAYRESRFTCENRPVVTLLYGTFQIPDDTINSMVRRIVCGERDVLADHSQPFYSVIITARSRLRAGASYLNAFSSFVRPDVKSDALALLLAHETMHAWLPRKLRVTPGPGEPPGVEFSSFHDIRYDWFHEGFTEYLARILLVRIGLASQEWFVQRLNDDLARLAVHPYRTIPVRDLEDAARTGRYNNHHQQLSYYRGAAMAFNWDATIRRASLGNKDLVDGIRSLIAAAADSGRLRRPRFEQVLEAFGVPAAHDVERYAFRGDEIAIDSAGLDADWVLRYRQVPAFRPGFDVPASMNADSVIGVHPDGPAHAAGLRNGMPIVRTTNLWRWGEDWKADQPATVVVRTAGGERTIQLSTVRGEILIPHFAKRALIRRE